MRGARKTSGSASTGRFSTRTRPGLATTLQNWKSLRNFFPRTGAGAIPMVQQPLMLARSPPNGSAPSRARSSSECAKSPAIRDRADEPIAMDELEQRQFVEALETLPCLTRATFLLSARDNLSYPEIGWRCGIGVDEVTVRIADALFGIDRAMNGRPSVAGRIRCALLPYRDAWAAARKREGDRCLA